MPTATAPENLTLASAAYNTATHAADSLSPRNLDDLSYALTQLIWVRPDKAMEETLLAAVNAVCDAWMALEDATDPASSTTAHRMANEAITLARTAILAFHPDAAQMPTTATTALTLTTADITVTTDHMGRVYAVIPDAIARPLAVASLEGIDPEARGIFFESVAHPADSWAAATVRTIFEALLTSPAVADDDHMWGLSQYRTWDGGSFYGFIVGESGWDEGTRWWRDYDRTGDLRVRGNASIAHRSRRHLAGTCTF